METPILSNATWLSEIVESATKAPNHTKADSEIGIQERVQRCLHRIHSFYVSTMIGTSLLVIIVAICVIYGLVHATPPQDSSFKAAPSIQATTVDKAFEMGSALSGVAGALANISGVLFAVVVFGIQFHGQSLGKASFLVRYLSRRTGLVPIASFTLVVVGVNVIVSMICAHGLAAAAAPLAWSNYILVPLVLLCTLWLFYRMVVSVSGDFFKDDLLPGLAWEYMRAIDNEVSAKRYEEVFKKLLRKFQLNGPPYTLLNGEQIVFKASLPKTGMITDVNIVAIRYLAQAIHEVSTCSIALEASIFGAASDVSLVVTVSASTDVTSIRQRFEKLGVIQNTTDLLREAFLVRGHQISDVAYVLRRFEDVLVAQAAHDHADQFERALEVHEELIRLRLEREDAQEIGHAGLSPLPNYFGEYKYFQMAQAVVRSGDLAKMDVMFSFARRGLVLACRYNNSLLFQRFGEIVSTLYWNAIQNSSLAARAGERVDDIVGNVCMLFEFAKLRPNDLKTLVSQYPLTYQWVRWVIHLTKTAIDLNIKDDALNFHDRLFRWDDYHERRHRLRSPRNEFPPELTKILYLHLCGELFLGAWCLHTCQTKPEICSAAKSVWTEVIREFDDQQQVLAAWEEFHSGDFNGDAILLTLGVDNWRREQRKRRTLIVTTEWGEEEWVDLGLRAILLALHNKPGFTKSQIAPTSQQPDEVSLRNSLQGLLCEKASSGLLDIVVTEHDRAIESVLSLYRKRRLLFKLTCLRRVITGEISNEIIHTIEADYRLALANSRGWANTLESLGPRQAVQNNSPVSIICTCKLSKQLLVKECGSSGNLGAGLAEAVRHKENLAIGMEIHHGPNVLTKIASPSNIQECLMSAIEALRSQGFKPNLIVIPYDDRIIHAIFGVPAYEVQSSKNIFNHVGIWESIEVMSFPGSGAESIVVLDVSSYFSRTSSTAANETVFTDPDHTSHLETLARAEAATREEDIPEEQQIQVLVKASVASRLCVNNRQAGLKLLLNRQTMGYALPTDDTFFHKPTCSKINRCVAVRFVLDKDSVTTHLPCPICRPGEWEHFD